MWKRFWPGVVLLAVLAALSAVPEVPAQKKPAEVKPDAAAEQMRHLGSALDVAALGFSERDPVLLLAAARALRSVHTVPGTDGPAAGNDLGEPPPLLAESDRLLGKALEQARGSKAMTDLVRHAAEKFEPRRAEAGSAADAVRHIASAYDLAAIGRQEKSPELLVAAARVLRLFIASPGPKKATVENGKDEKGTREPPSLRAESDRLLAEAENMGTDNAALADLIKDMLKDKTRGATGGPKAYSHQPSAGATVTLDVQFDGKAPATITVQGNSRNLLTLTVTDPDGPHASSTGMSPMISWVPRATKTFKISVTNNGPGTCPYTLYHN
jgi:hypothetical protein